MPDLGPFCFRNSAENPVDGLHVIFSGARGTLSGGTLTTGPPGRVTATENQLTVFLSAPLAPRMPLCFTVWSEFEPITVNTALWSPKQFRQSSSRKVTVCRDIMAVKLNRTAFERAKTLVEEGKYVYDERDDWSEHRPSAEDENEFIRLHGFGQYAKWYLGIDDEKFRDTKGAYEFPYGDFKNVHRCGILSAESRAAQYKHHDIERAVAHLHGMIEARKHPQHTVGR